MTPVVYKFDGREVHMIGEYVGVVRYSGSKPFIDFPMIRISESTGKAWEDEDPSIAGGISADEAEVVSSELLLAAKYLRSIGE